MSSFRIDRQYVSFVTAETKTVIPRMQTDFAGGLASGGDVKPAPDRYCSEVMEQARRDAEREAARLLEKAGSEADGILEKARKTAGEMTEEARGRAEEIRESAERSGYSQGLKEAEAFAAERKKEEARQYAQLAEKLRQDYSDLVDGMREEIISLVINIVKKVIDFKIKQSDEVFLGIVNNALEQLKQAETVNIHVGSEDYQRYFGNGTEKAGIRAGEANVIITEEEGYSSGDLMVESEGEMLDYSINRQIERVEKALLREGA